MYELARDIFDEGRAIPKGTPVSDVYTVKPDGTVGAIAHIWGTRIKLRLIPTDLAQSEQSK